MVAFPIDGNPQPVLLVLTLKLSAPPSIPTLHTRPTHSSPSLPYYIICISIQTLFYYLLSLESQQKKSTIKPYRLDPTAPSSYCTISSSPLQKMFHSSESWYSLSHLSFSTKPISRGLHAFKYTQLTSVFPNLMVTSLVILLALSAACLPSHPLPISCHTFFSCLPGHLTFLVSSYLTGWWRIPYLSC